MKKILSGILMILSVASQSTASEIDILTNKLVQKKILTPLERQIILDETKQEVAKEVAEGKSYATPSWAQKIKFKGDLRLRLQGEKKENDDHYRNRSRLRFRLASEVQVNQKLKIAAGLATGGDDPRSTNQTMDNGFSTKNINLDYVYAKYKATSWLTIQAGKIKKTPFWSPSDLIWDTDINPEGIGLNFEYAINSQINLFYNSSYFSLDEYKKDLTDPMLAVQQLGVITAFNSKATFKAAYTMYNFQGLNANADTSFYDAMNTAGFSGGTNSTSACAEDPGKNCYTYQYNSQSLSLELGFKDIIPQIPYLAFIAETISNPDPDEENQGSLYGIKIGDKKVKKQGQWQFKYLNRHLEKDAFLDIFPDSDAYGGKTAVEGTEVVFQYGLDKNVILGLDYYDMKPIDDKATSDNESDNKQQLIQADLMIKF